MQLKRTEHFIWWALVLQRLTNLSESKWGVLWFGYGFWHRESIKESVFRLFGGLAACFWPFQTDQMQTTAIVVYAFQNPA